MDKKDVEELIEFLEDNTQYFKVALVKQLYANARIGQTVLEEAAQTVNWYQSSVRPAKTPRMPLSVANNILREWRWINNDLEDK